METTELNNFYPRSPCGERPMPFSLRFASFNFYPRSPCGERQAVLHVHFFCVTISIHALLAESDDNSRHCSPRNTQNFYPRSPCGERHFTFTADTKQKQFLSTLSLRRATEVVVQRVVESGISIHALLAESDQCPFRSGLHLSISIHALLAESDGSWTPRPAPPC